MNRPWPLVGRELAGDPLDELLGATGLSGAKHDKGNDGFAEVGVGTADHGHLGHGAVLEQASFDFASTHLEAAGLDEVGVFAAEDADAE